MNLSPKTTDNVTELLTSIREFTERRDEILTQNLVNFRTPGFVPRDLDAMGFTEVMTYAISEYIANKHILLQDTETIKFGENGSFESSPIIDRYSKELLKNDINEYVRLQIRKTSENLLNKKLADRLLKQKQKQHLMA